MALYNEIIMGKLADAWAAEVQAQSAVKAQLDAAVANVKKLSDLNAQLTALTSGSSSGSVSQYRTPAGYIPDAADGAAIDAIIAKNSVNVPVPNV